MGTSLALEERFQSEKALLQSFPRHFLFQPPHGGGEQRARPAQIEQHVRLEGAGRFHMRSLFGGELVVRDEFPSAAAFQAMGISPFAGEEVFHRGQKEGAKPSLVRVLAMIVNFTPASVNNYTTNALGAE